MTSFRQQVIQCADYIISRIQVRPRIGFITGTGLSDTLENLEVIWTFDYTNLPHFPNVTVATHKGRLIYGRLEGKEIFVFQGRFHLYEGYSPQAVTFPVRLLQELAVPILKDLIRLKKISFI